MSHISLISSCTMERPLPSIILLIALLLGLTAHALATGDSAFDLSKQVSTADFSPVDDTKMSSDQVQRLRGDIVARRRERSLIPLPPILPGLFLINQSPMNAYGPSMCNGQPGGEIVITGSTLIPSPFTIPSECLPHAQTTEKECSNINWLWNNHFLGCCPFLGVTYPQSDLSSPTSSGQFFFGGSTLSDIGVPKLVAAKWVGTAGCKVWWDCTSLKDKAHCHAMGGVCVWEKLSCVESASIMDNLYSAV